ncbi:MAG: peptidoglycan-binding protein [Candidatus Nealsonbacteria bacterium]|nr:peptidoglycan-binding protein [Candidatus Nealsonbacteria bacterium]
MKNIKYVFIAAGLLLGLLSFPASAVNTTIASTTTAVQLQQLIQSLQQQIATLQAQMQTLNQARSQVKETTKEVSTTFRLINQLRLGMTGEDVKLLQEILATDPDIYPEGLITGRFGKLTEKAVKKFQQKACLDQFGNVGPKTLSKINELLEEGAGNSGKVPPGLLRAPGILKKFCATSSLISTPDVIPPVMSEIMATGIASTSVKITWVTNEKANSKVWYGNTTPFIVSTTTVSVSSSEFSLAHSLTISGLTASTTYYYLISSVDKAGNKTVGTEKSFTTLSQ